MAKISTAIGLALLVIALSVFASPLFAILLFIPGAFIYFALGANKNSAQVSYRKGEFEEEPERYSGVSYQVNENSKREGDPR